MSLIRSNRAQLYGTAPRDRRLYLVRERDATLPASWPAPPEDPYLEPLAGDPGRWHEYVGNQIYRDFTLDGGVMTPTARYTHAGAADGALLAIDGGPGYTLSQRRFFHGDMLGTTRPEDRYGQPASQLQELDYVRRW